LPQFDELPIPKETAPKFCRYNRKPALCNYFCSRM